MQRLCEKTSTVGKNNRNTKTIRRENITPASKEKGVRSILKGQDLINFWFAFQSFPYITEGQTQTILI